MTSRLHAIVPLLRIALVAACWLVHRVCRRHPVIDAVVGIVGAVAWGAAALAALLFSVVELQPWRQPLVADPLAFVALWLVYGRRDLIGNLRRLGAIRGRHHNQRSKSATRGLFHASA